MRINKIDLYNYIGLDNKGIISEFSSSVIPVKYTSSKWILNGADPGQIAYCTPSNMGVY